MIGLGMKTVFKAEKKENAVGERAKINIDQLFTKGMLKKMDRLPLN